MKGAFARNFDALAEIFDATRRFYEGNAVDEQHRFAVDLAIEEIFTNMVKFHKTADGPIEIELCHEGSHLRVVLTDHDVERYDMTAGPEVDVDAPIDDRQPGGLGLHLTQQMMSSVSYKYDDRTSRVIMTRDLE